jgi:hypothetical protein
MLTHASRNGLCFAVITVGPASSPPAEANPMLHKSWAEAAQRNMNRPTEATTSQPDSENVANLQQTMQKTPTVPVDKREAVAC